MNSFSLDDIVDGIGLAEGFRSTLYLDTNGFAHVGYGLCVDGRVPGAGITEPEARVIMRMRLVKLKSEIIENRTLSPAFYQCNPARKYVMLAMAYQLGVGGLAMFTNTIDLISKRDFKGAAVEMLRSRWAAQTPERARVLSEIMSRGHDDGRY